MIPNGADKRAQTSRLWDITAKIANLICVCQINFILSIRFLWPIKIVRVFQLINNSNKKQKRSNKVRFLGEKSKYCPLV